MTESPPSRETGAPDLRAALNHARRRDKRVLAVVAGHMHTRTHAGERSWRATEHGTLYVNAARVPRIWEERDGKYRYHLALEVGSEVTAREVLMREDD